jgi:hypothetical protein
MDAGIEPLDKPVLKYTLQHSIVSVSFVKSVAMTQIKPVLIPLFSDTCAVHLQVYFGGEVIKYPYIMIAWDEMNLHTIITQ